MNPVTIYPTPPAHPQVCIKCTSGVNSRNHFVDLGFSLEYVHMNQQINGPMYFCNACITDIIVQYSVQLPKFLANETNRLRQIADQKDTMIQNLQTDNKTIKTRWEEAKNEIVRLTKIVADKNLEISALGSLDASLLTSGITLETEAELDGNESTHDGPSPDSDGDDSATEPDDRNTEGDSGGDSSESDANDGTLTLGPKPVTI